MSLGKDGSQGSLLPQESWLFSCLPAMHRGPQEREFQIPPFHLCMCGPGYLAPLQKASMFKPEAREPGAGCEGQGEGEQAGAQFTLYGEFTWA